MAATRVCAGLGERNLPEFRLEIGTNRWQFGAESASQLLDH